MSRSPAALLLLRERYEIASGVFAELVVWRVPEPVSTSTHAFKYRLALIENGICVLRYDNEAGKGDHRHVDAGEEEYVFTDLETLQVDFWGDVEARMKR